MEPGKPLNSANVHPHIIVSNTRFHVHWSRLNRHLNDILNCLHMNQITGYFERASDFYCLAFKGPRLSWVVERIPGLRR